MGMTSEDRIYILHIICILIFLCITSFLYADFPKRSNKYIIYSPNKEYYIESTPYVVYSINLGKTIVYNRDGKIAYQIEEYFRPPVFLGNNGTIICINNRLYKDGIYKLPAIIIVKPGGDKMNIYLHTIVKDFSTLTQTVSHLIWTTNFGWNDKNFFIITKEKKTFLISFDSCDFHEIKHVDVNEYFSIQTLETTIYNTIEYPHSNSFPPLATGEEFKDVLIQNFNFREMKRDKGEIYIYISSIINKNGVCEETVVEIRENEKENKFLEKEISEWLVKQQFDSSVLPFEKWCFSYYLYTVRK
jgi:hypothetical protein